MIIHREVGPSYHDKPIVQWVNYSPLMVERKEERWPEATPAAIPPLIFLQQIAAASILCFSCFSAASLWERPGDPLYS
jgi:hypothetical protein